MTNGLEREYSKEEIGYQRVTFLLLEGTLSEAKEGGVQYNGSGSPHRPTGTVWCAHCEEDFHESDLVQLDTDGDEVITDRARITKLFRRSP